MPLETSLLPIYATMASGAPGFSTMLGIMLFTIDNVPSCPDYGRVHRMARLNLSFPWQGPGSWQTARLLFFF